MAEMGKYCKAYLLKDLRVFNGWLEKSENARKEKKEIDGQQVEVTRDLTDDSIVFLQENHIITDGIFMDENIIFENVTSEWIAFCKQSLGFEIPNYVSDHPKRHDA